MNAQEIALAFMHDRYRRNLCLQHYTPAKWFECDVCEITEGGYMREYEIKISRSDFLADAKKCRDTEYIRESRTWKNEKKYDMLAAGEPTGPTNFTFILPKGLVKHEEIPEWAGLIEVEPVDGRHVIPYRLTMRRVLDGRRLHTQRCDEKVIKHMRGVCYYRMHNLLIEHARLSAKKSSDKDPADPVYDFSQPISAPSGETQPT